MFCSQVVEGAGHFTGRRRALHVPEPRFGYQHGVPGRGGAREVFGLERRRRGRRVRVGDEEARTVRAQSDPGVLGAPDGIEVHARGARGDERTSRAARAERRLWRGFHVGFLQGVARCAVAVG